MALPANPPETDLAEAPVSLRRNISWTLLGDTVYAACQWGILVALAKLGRVEMVGQFALALAITSPVYAFSQLHLRSVQATDATRGFRFADYLGLRLVTTAGASAVVWLILLWAGYTSDTALIVLLVSLFKALESISDVYYGALQQNEDMSRICMSMCARGTLSLSAFAAGVYLARNTAGGVTGMVIAAAVVLLLYDSRSSAQPQHARSGNALSKYFGGCVRPKWDLAVQTRLVRLALPLGIVMMLVALNASIPRFFIERHLGGGALGIFSAIAYLLVAGSTLVVAVGQAVTPRLAKLYAQGKLDEFKALFAKLLGGGAMLGGAGVIAALVVGRPLLELVYRPEYALHADLLVWLMFGGAVGFIASLLGFGITATRSFMAQVPLFAAACLASLLASYWLIPAHGLLGGAGAMITSMLVQAVWCGAILRRDLKKAKSRAAPCTVEAVTL